MVSMLFVAVLLAYGDLWSTKREPRPYDLSNSERTARFVSSAGKLWAIDAKVKTVVATLGQRDVLRIGCVGWSERSCIAAGNFLLLLSQADWKIEGNKVNKLEPLAKLAGARAYLYDKIHCVALEVAASIELAVLLDVVGGCG